jgi:hypothetical protein
VNWFIIILIIAGVLLVIKILHLRHLKHRIFSVFIVFILLFLIGSIYFVSKQNNIDMTTVNGFGTGMKIYAGWLLSSFQNIKTITGYAIGLDWSSKNKTISLNNSLVNGNKNIGEKIADTTVNVANKVKANTPKLITSYR